MHLYHKFAAIFLLILAMFQMSRLGYFIACSSKQADDRVLALAGDKEITVAEFRKRFELNPRLKLIRSTEEAKRRFLGSLIAEKLLALEAESSQQPVSERTRIFLEQIERELAIEELYNQKIAATIQVDEAEIRAAFAKSRRELQVQYASFKIREQALEFRTRLLSGIPFQEAMASIQSNGSGWIESDTVALSWGKAEPEIEEALFRLKLGEVSEPIPAANQFHVAKIVGEKLDAFASEQDFQTQKEAIAKMLQRRKAKAEFVHYFKKMMAGKDTDLPAERFKFLVEKMEEVFSVQEDSTNYARTLNPAPMNESEFIHATRSLESNLDQTLVTFDDGTGWTLREFLQRLSVARVHLDFSNRKNFRRSLRSAVITMIEQEYVYKEAVREGMQHATNVRKEVEIWRASLASQNLARELLLGNHHLTEEQEIPALTNEQLSRLTDRLLLANEKYDVEINRDLLDEVQVTNAGLLVFKTHFPGRLVTPPALPLENLDAWQEAVSSDQ